jgi:macrophage erythroblast attacher
MDRSFSTCFDKVSSVKNPNCPVCNVHLKTIAKVLPYAHCSVSKLICAQSREPINESNPPLMLPNGYVYGSKVRTKFFLIAMRESCFSLSLSLQTLQAMAAANNGKVTCPRTKETYDLTQAEKVYIM